MEETKKVTKKEVALNPKVWEVPYNADLIAQVLYVFFSNERKGTSSVKVREMSQVVVENHGNRREQVELEQDQQDHLYG
jgi:ribosomal protein L4